MFQYNERSMPRWRQLRSIDHDFGRHGKRYLILSISNNKLICCSVNETIIKVYSLSGELLQTYRTRRGGDAGRLCTSFISDNDDDGSVLIADWINDRLQVMSEQGEFSVPQLQPPVSGPSSAVLFNRHLYVTSIFDNHIHKYAC